MWGGGHLHRICSGTGLARWAASLKIVAAGLADLEQTWQVSPTKTPEGPLMRSGRISPKGRATVPASLGPPSSTPAHALSFLLSRGAPPRSGPPWAGVPEVLRGGVATPGCTPEPKSAAQRCARRVPGGTAIVPLFSGVSGPGADPGGCRKPRLPFSTPRSAWRGV